MKVTDLIIADKDIRTRRKAIGLIKSIEQRMAYYKKKTPDLVSPAMEAEAEKWLRNLSIIVADLHGPPEINISLTRREMIKRPTKEILRQIYGHLPEPIKRQYNDYEHAIIKQMQQTGEDQRAAQHKTLLMYEIAEKTTKNYYMVFNTLTVRNDSYHKVFNKDSTAFKQYIRDYEKRLSKDSAETHTYFAVVEEGATTGRLHIHVIHFSQTLPAESRDPNYGREIPDRREITRLKSLWEYGFSTPIMVRYSPNDAYGQAGYRWPYDNRENKPLKINSPLALANYMSKYINKSYHSTKRNKLLWRVRKSHTLGKQIITELLSTLEMQDLLNIATNPTITTTLNNSKIPPALLRQMCLKRYSDQNTENLLPSLYTMGKNIKPMPSPLQSSQDSILTSLENNRQNIGVTRITTTKNKDEFNETRQKLNDGAKRIDTIYFREPTGEYGTTTTKDYIH